MLKYITLSMVLPSESHTIVSAQLAGHLQTKLKSAIRIAASGKTVAVARCETPTAESVITTGTSTTTSYTTLQPNS